MLFRSASKRKPGIVPVYLNVYDLTPINGYAYWLGLGVYHSGIQVHGTEYAYGAHDHSSTGIFEGEPRQCPGFVFRKSKLIGRTDLGPREVRQLMEDLANQYSGNTYNLISKNCNHFCNTASVRLTGEPIPNWVNRLAKLGFLCKCVLPVQVAAVRSKAAEERSKAAVVVDKDGEFRNLRSTSVKYPPADGAGDTMHPLASASSTSRGRRRFRRTTSASGVATLKV